jgi:hypothetical protein
MVAEVWRFVYLAISPLLTRANADPLYTALLAALQHFTFAAGKCVHEFTAFATIVRMLRLPMQEHATHWVCCWIAAYITQYSREHSLYVWSPTLIAGTLGVKDARNQLLSALCELTLLSQEELAVVPRQGMSKQVGPLWHVWLQLKADLACGPTSQGHVPQIMLLLP